MIFLEAASFVVGSLFGIVLCNLLWEDVQIRNSLSEKKTALYYLVSSLYMGCAFLCASRYAQANSGLESLVLLAGLIFLAVYAIQDMIELAVYEFLLNMGAIGVVVLKSATYLFDCEFTQLFSFLILSASVYVGLKAIARVFPKTMGCGDYDILFLIYALCGNQGMIQVLYASSFIGLLIYVPKLLLRRAKKDEKIPLAPILYLGTLAYFGL